MTIIYFILHLVSAFERLGEGVRHCEQICMLSPSDSCGWMWPCSGFKAHDLIRNDRSFKPQASAACLSLSLSLCMRVSGAGAAAARHDRLSRADGIVCGLVFPHTFHSPSMGSPCFPTPSPHCHCQLCKVHCVRLLLPPAFPSSLYTFDSTDSKAFASCRKTWQTLPRATHMINEG